MKDQGRSKRRRTGGRRRPFRKKKKRQLGRESTETRVGEPKLKTVDARGNAVKLRAISAATANVAADGEVVEADIVGVVGNDADPNYVRRNIITKGAVIAVDLDGERREARVTSRPGQDGQVNAVLVGE